MTQQKITGSCLCGAIEYEVADKFKYAGFCHCSDCQKFSGSAFSAFGGLAKQDLTIISGESLIGSFEKSPDSIMTFCSRCGSSLYSDKTISGLVHIRLGTLDKAPSKKPQLHIFVASKADWHEIGDELPQFEGMPEGR